MGIYVLGRCFLIESQRTREKREEKKMSVLSSRLTIIENGEVRVEQIKDIDAVYGDRIANLRFCEEGENSLDLDKDEHALSCRVLNCDTLLFYMLPLSHITTLWFDIIADTTSWCTVCCKAFERHQQLTSVNFGQLIFRSHYATKLMASRAYFKESLFTHSR